MLMRKTVLSGLVGLIFTGIALAANVKITVLSQAGGPFPDVLVIVKSLEGRGEMLRALSDSQGDVKTTLPVGMYRLIATCPFGICLTEMKEFIVSKDMEQISITVGAIGTVQTVFIGKETAKLILLDKANQPFSHCTVMIRNWDDSEEYWYVPDSKGIVNIKIYDNPQVLVIFTDTQLVSKVLHFQCNKFGKLKKNRYTVQIKLPF